MTYDALVRPPARSDTTQVETPQPKGWCPGALRPMAALDGLIVRLRLPGGRLSASAAFRLADLAIAHGSGILELSSRGNLQLRGLATSAHPRLIEGLTDLSLLDATPDVEAARNILVSPLAGLHDGLDLGPILISFGRLFQRGHAITSLPSKMLWLIDDGSVPSLAATAADVRFDWTGEAFSIGLGGTRAKALRLGLCDADAIDATASNLARTLSRLFAKHLDLRRVAALVRRVGPEALAEACGCPLRPSLDEGIAVTADNVCGHRSFGGRPVFGAAPPFGRMTADMLQRLAEAAQDEMRLTPWRTILLPDAHPRFARDLVAAGFIVDADDPRLHVSACVGRAGCAQATTDTLDDAAAIAAFASPARPIHVSGCSKGCAHPLPAPVTLVGRDGHYDLVRAGSARNVPARRGLRLDEVRAELGGT